VRGSKGKGREGTQSFSLLFVVDLHPWLKALRERDENLPVVTLIHVTIPYP